MRLTLCIDALEPQLSGIGRYTHELVQRLPRRPELSDVRFFGRNELIEDPTSLVRGELPSSRRGIAGPYQRWRKRALLRSSVVHGPNYFLPPFAEMGVITVHDLSVFHYPEHHPVSRVEDFESNLRRSIDRSQQLITDCETIRSELIDFAGVAPNRVTAVPLGISEGLRPVAFEDRAVILRRLGLPLSGYGLTISALEPRKRIGRLISAWRELPRQTRDRFPLVVAGGAGWNNAALHAELGRGAAEGWVLPLGYVAESDLPAVYSGAALFAYPSIYEGFGLPPLEAMACGVPTVVAAGSCLTEVTQGAAMIADTDNIPELARILSRALEDDQWRSGAISAGIQVASSYTWDRCVDETLAVYQRVTSS